MGPQPRAISHSVSVKVSPDMSGQSGPCSCLLRLVLGPPQGLTVMWIPAVSSAGMSAPGGCRAHLETSERGPVVASGLLLGRAHFLGGQGAGTSVTQLLKFGFRADGACGKSALCGVERPSSLPCPLMDNGVLVTPVILVGGSVLPHRTKGGTAPRRVPDQVCSSLGPVFPLWPFCLQRHAYCRSGQKTLRKGGTRTCTEAEGFR